MKNIFNSLKGILGNEQDPLLGAIKKAMRILAYDYETDNDGKSITWKSHATLTPLAKQDCPPLATI